VRARQQRPRRQPATPGLSPSLEDLVLFLSTPPPFLHLPTSFLLSQPLRFLFYVVDNVNTVIMNTEASETIQVPKTPSPVPTPPPEMNDSLPSPGSRFIAHANGDLIQNQPQSALTTYTDVLNYHEPHHPVAFLNRSLCYLLLDYPHLAVMDAYRALFCVKHINTLYEDDPHGRMLLNMALTQELLEENEGEISEEPHCYAGRGIYDWLNVPLARVTIASHIWRDDNNKIRTERATRLEMITDIVAKAYYRIAVGLWKCGGGALKSANDVICLALSDDACTQRGGDMQFSKLQNLILEKMEKAMTNEAEVKISLIQTRELKNDPQSLAQYDESGVRALFASGFTKVPKELYPWDKSSMTWDNHQNVLAKMNETLQHKTNGLCKFEIKKDPDRPPQLVLIAGCDIPLDEEIFHEKELAPAATPAWEKRGDNDCGFCGSMLNVTHDLYVKSMKQAVEWQKTLDGYTGDKEELVYMLESDFRRSCYSSPTDTSVNSNSESDSSDTSSAAAGPPEGFQLCPVCTSATFCSKDCHRSAIPTHLKSMCSNNVLDIPNCKPVPPEWSGLPSASAQNLLNQLLFRVIAHLLEGAAHEFPLEDFMMHILHTDMNTPKRLFLDSERADQARCIIRWRSESKTALHHLFPEKRESKFQVSTPSLPANPPTMAPWSYHSNIIEPINALYKMGYKRAVGSFEASALDLALDTRRFDGWMLETMRQKVAFGLRMAPFPRFAMTFNEDGQVVSKACVTPCTLFAPFNVHKAQEFEEEEKDEGGEGEKEKAWMAFLHPIHTALEQADPEKGERANVRLFERQGARWARAAAVPAGPEMEEEAEEEGPAVREGERLLCGAGVVAFVQPRDDPDGAFGEGLGVNLERLSLEGSGDEMGKSDVEHDEAEKSANEFIQNFEGMSLE